MGFLTVRLTIKTTVFAHLHLEPLENSGFGSIGTLASVLSEALTFSGLIFPIPSPVVLCVFAGKEE